MHTTLLILQIICALAAAAVVAALFVARRRGGGSVAPRTRNRLLGAIAGICMVFAASAAADSVNEKNANMNSYSQNPFFEPFDTPFGVPPFDKIEPRHFMPAFERAMQLHTAEIDSIKNNPEPATFDNTIVALDRSGEMLETVSSVFFMLTSAETNDELQEIEERISPVLSEHLDRVAMDSVLFGRVKAVYDNRASQGLDSLQLRLLEKIYDDAVRSGALLSPSDKARLKEINGTLSLLEVRFGANLLSATNDYELVLTSKNTEGLPSSVISAARDKAEQLKLGEDKLVFTLHNPSRIPFLTYSTSRDLRRQIYEAYVNRCADTTKYDNTGIINDMVRLRTEKAHLLGYGSYAEYVLAKRMAARPENVYALLDELWTPALELAGRELESMRAIKAREEGDDGTFEPWDWWYYAEKVRRSEYSFDEESVRPYLSLENVKSGIFELSNRLYGVTFRPVKAPVYHSECMVYEVLDYDNSHLGVLYLDFFPREGKAGGAWCGTYRDQSYKDSVRISPVVSIVCNFSRPAGSSPALLTVDETETFFHEFGHALHNFFKDVPYRGLGGVERDFVELPSQIMENWAFEPQLLKSYALHYRTGDVIPDRHVNRLRSSKLFNQGFATVEYLAASLSDMDIHSMQEYAPFDVAAFEMFALRNKRGLIPQIEPRYRYPYFSHIFNGGYAAGYYGYIWAEVLDKDAFQYFKDSGELFNRTLARKFRSEVLARGGAADGMTLYKAFRGQEPSREPLLKARGLWVEPEVPDSVDVR